MGQASVFGRVLSNDNAPDVPTVGAETLTLEEIGFSEKSKYVAPVKIKKVIATNTILIDLFLFIAFKTLLL